MAKKDKSNEVEYLRGLVRSMKAEIRHMKKELSRFTKRSNQYATYLEDAEELRVAEEMLAEEKTDKKLLNREQCPECGGNIEIVDLGVRKIYICEKCRARQVKRS